MSVHSEIRVVRAAGDRLGDELVSLTPEQWDLPGACGVWTVGEVVAHLTQWADAYADLIRHALTEDVLATPAPPVLPYAVRAARYAEEAKAYRRELGDGLLDAYVRSQRQLVDRFERVMPTTCSYSRRRCCASSSSSSTATASRSIRRGTSPRTRC